MNKKTRMALEKSIYKWEGVVKGFVDDRGHENCALCQEFIGLGCEGCPVKRVSGQMNCRNTPYVNWTDHGARIGTFWATTPKMKRLALDELNFLKSLRPVKRRTR